MMSIFCTKTLSIFLYFHVVSDKNGINVSKGCLNLRIYFYICIFVACTVYLFVLYVCGISCNSQLCGIK